MPEKEYHRVDNRLTAMMVEDMIFDPILASKVILGLSIPPHQQLRILEMWTRHYMVDDSGFSTGKSTTCAIVIALRSVLFPDRVAGIVSGTFRQGKIIFSNLDRWYNSSSIFRSCVKHFQGRPRITHGSDLWEMSFRGGSIARCLPPNFVADSIRIQSERWNDGYFDEWKTFNIMSLTRVLIGRVTKVNPNPDCPIRQNHIYTCGTPGFQHDPAYSVVKRVQGHVARGDEDYTQFTCNYRHVPDTLQWKGFIDRKTINTMQTLNPAGIVGSEVDGIWQKDSQTFYLSSSIDNSRISNMKFQDRRLNDHEIFLASFDTARGGGDESDSKTDDFSITIAKVVDDNLVHVKTDRHNNVSSEQMASVVQREHSMFHFSLIAYDPGGGGLFVKDDLKKNELLINEELVLVTPILDMSDTSGIPGLPILIPFKRGFVYTDLMWGKSPSDSVTVNRLHREASAAIANQKYLLAPEWSGWDELGRAWDADAKREWLNNHPGLSGVDRQKAEMDLAVCQLITVDVERDRATGKPKVDKFGMYKFTSKFKKDSAYSLIYTFYCFKIWSYLQSIGNLPEGNEDEEETVIVGAL